ncbi:MAG: UDP-N-acetylglucosamine 4,6-dehydratase [Sphingomonadales bacterium]|jgi:FlaA1/EpsC-like NDP-sugar epimerase|nr:UDP-N-acetylglucosamine 4,6-dehydratase [Sphingomonadales bacterium]
MIPNLILRISSTGRMRKRAILMAYDLAAMLMALWAAFSARLGKVYFPDNPVVLGAAAISCGVGIVALYRLQVYHLVLRYFDLRAVTRLLAAAAIAGVGWVIVVYLTRAQIRLDGLVMLVPRSVGVIYAGFLFLLLFMGRYAMALLISGAVRDAPGGKRDGRRNVAIYGANAAGISLAESMRGNPDYRLAAFVEDEPALHGQILAGTPIYSPEALPDLVRSADIEEVFLAMPKATRSQRLVAISRLTKLELKVKTVPAPEEIVSGRFTVTDVRPISVNDLLRRDPVEPLTELIREAAEGKSILITGAGGSIGSEICRQIAHARPRRLVLLDHSEFALYTIEQQLDEASHALPSADRPQIVAVVGSILNRPLLEELIARHEVDTIYHAAAYKHVPLLEHNEVVGVENNVIGTLVLAQVAIATGIDRFTMISTDKAVRPESVMGASKRAAELVIQARAADPACKTRFGIVRFGNVLDSSGSVVQRFRAQIRRGGPVTVTHEEVTRFFMSIPEATQLVLQAGAMAAGGEVFVLDMGEPIRIAELARNMITLSGMTVRDADNPHGDIEITYVGLRPGEKLYEELFVGENVVATAHPRIRMAKERFLPLKQLEAHTERVRAAIEARDSVAVRQSLRELLEPEQQQLGGNVTLFRRA